MLPLSISKEAHCAQTSQVCRPAEESGLWKVQRGPFWLWEGPHRAFHRLWQALLGLLEASVGHVRTSVGCDGPCWALLGLLAATVDLLHHKPTLGTLKVGQDPAPVPPIISDHWSYCLGLIGLVVQLWVPHSCCRLCCSLWLPKWRLLWSVFGGILLAWLFY